MIVTVAVPPTIITSDEDVLSDSENCSSRSTSISSRIVIQTHCTDPTVEPAGNTTVAASAA